MFMFSRISWVFPPIPAASCCFFQRNAVPNSATAAHWMSRQPLTGLVLARMWSLLKEVLQLRAGSRFQAPFPPPLKGLRVDPSNSPGSTRDRVDPGRLGEIDGSGDWVVDDLTTQTLLLRGGGLGQKSPVWVANT